MGSIISKFFFVFILVAFAACSILKNGVYDQHGQYVPKNSNFKLKDKQGIVAIGIDTTSIYKLVEMYNNGILVFPTPSIDNELNSVHNYIKFYGKGRCLIFSIAQKNDLGFPNSLKEDDLNPNNKHYNKNYYYSTDGKNIQIESFVYGDGKGHYVVSIYKLSDSGNILTTQEKYFKIIYKKEPIPLNWNRYGANW